MDCLITCFHTPLQRFVGFHKKSLLLLAVKITNVIYLFSSLPTFYIPSDALRVLYNLNNEYIN